MAMALPTAGAEKIACVVTPTLNDCMSHIGGSFVATTYQAGKVAAVGWSGSAVSVLLRDCDRPMGLAFDGTRLAVATRDRIVLLANATALAPHYPPESPTGYDAIFLPRSVHITGNLGIHDVAFGKSELWFVNTSFSCLSVTSNDYSFMPRWQPSFISELEPEDRCHLNGLAMRDGQPAYVTALGATDVREGWRQRKADGGVLIDVTSNEIVLSGLSMPHSPRWHDGKLWLLNSGAGEVGVVDLKHGLFTPVCALPGFLRGLCFAGPYAIIGLSKVRHQEILSGLPIEKSLHTLKCGVAVVDLRTGRMTGMLEFTAACQELYDVEFLAGIQRPMIRTLTDEDAPRAVTAPGVGYFFPPGEKNASPSDGAPDQARP